MQTKKRKSFTLLWPKAKIARLQLQLKIALGALFISWSVLFVIIILGILQYQKYTLSFRANPVYSTQLPLRFSPPRSISFGTQVKELPVESGAIEEGIWQTSDTAATHLQTSSRPGEGGNVVIYGHNKRHLFGSLHAVAVGDTIEVTTTDNKIFTYTVTEKKIVNPDQIEVVLPTDFEVLTLYTCTGFLDRQRLIIQASPTSSSS